MEAIPETDKKHFPAAVPVERSIYFHCYLSWPANDQWRTPFSPSPSSSHGSLGFGLFQLAETRFEKKKKKVFQVSAQLLYVT